MPRLYYTGVQYYIIQGSVVCVSARPLHPLAIHNTPENSQRNIFPKKVSFSTIFSFFSFKMPFIKYNFVHHLKGFFSAVLVSHTLFGPQGKGEDDLIWARGALVTKLTTRWCHLHCLALPYWHHQLVSSSARVTSVKSQQGQ